MIIHSLIKTLRGIWKSKKRWKGTLFPVYMYNDVILLSFLNSAKQWINITWLINHVSLPRQSYCSNVCSQISVRTTEWTSVSLHQKHCQSIFLWIQLLFVGCTHPLPDTLMLSVWGPLWAETCHCTGLHWTVPAGTGCPRSLCWPRSAAPAGLRTRRWASCSPGGSDMKPGWWTNANSSLCVNS